MIVKKLRESRNWSQEQLAQMAGLSMRTVQRVEAGNNASMETLKSLAAVFEVSIDTLTEEIIVIDKASASWRAEPWFIRLFLFGVRRRSHMLALEYLMLAGGVVALLLERSALVVGMVFFGAYLDAKLMAYIDERAYW